VEVKDLFGRYVNDVIATTAFGLIIDSLNHQNNHFYKMGLKSSNFTELQIFKVTFFSTYPKLMKVFDSKSFKKNNIHIIELQLIGSQIFDAKVVHFFRSLVLNTIKFREREGISRPDMLNLLQQARNGTISTDSVSVEDYVYDIKSIEPEKSISITYKIHGIFSYKSNELSHVLQIGPMTI
jgi:hypothetical protein